MTCIDSSHGGDSGGGKLQTFGVVATKKHGRGCDYRRTFLPFIFSRILQENEVAAVFLITTLIYHARRLFGFRLNICGGLISDHANAFVNAYTQVFPEEPWVNDFRMCRQNSKTNREEGQRRRGTPGYLKLEVRS
jgi:hypothetical protein